MKLIEITLRMPSATTEDGEKVLVNVANIISVRPLGDAGSLIRTIDKVESYVKETAAAILQLITGDATSVPAAADSISES